MVKRLLVLFGIALMLFSCKKDEVEIKNDLVVASHAGGGFETFTNGYPSNSEVAIRRAIEGLGIKAVEIDIQLSKDEIFFLYHDQNLQSQTDCSGCIPSMTSEEIASCSYDRNQTSISQSQKIFPLMNVLERYASTDVVFFLDVRLENVCDPTQVPRTSLIANKIAALIENFGAHRLPVISNDTFLLNTLERRNNSIQTFFDNNEFSKAYSTCCENSFDGICMNNDRIDAEQAGTITRSGKKLILFNVKTYEGHIRAIEKSPWCIQSDNIELFVEIMKNR